LVRKLQLVTLKNLPHYFQNFIASFQLQM